MDDAVLEKKNQIKDLLKDYDLKDQILMSEYNSFDRRHIGLLSDSSSHVDEILGILGYESLKNFIQDVVPKSIYRTDALNLPDALSEREALAALKNIADKNISFRSLIGQGYYGTETPNVILRNIFENPAWYTAYTPYQPEISQGRLEALFNFQTIICDLTKMDIANASMLDEGTAAAEAMALCRRSSKNKSNNFFIDEDCFPQTIAVVKTRAEAAGYDVVVDSPSTIKKSCDYFGVLLQYPGNSGEIASFDDVIDIAHKNKSLVVMAADILSLLILKSPGELGVDVTVGSTQRFGVPIGFGGPHAAFIATKNNYQRSLPGRLVGMSLDAKGNKAYRLALQTREQHIRREKATSNICTAQVLLAVIASMYVCYHGAKGLLEISRRVHWLTKVAAAGLESYGFQIINKSFFDTLTLHTDEKTESIKQRALHQKVNLKLIDQSKIGFSIDELSNEEEIEKLWFIFTGDTSLSFDLIASKVKVDWNSSIFRKDEILKQTVFSDYQSETEMMRYLRKLSDKDLALDRTMIPLGSCTMKLNATSEMIPVSWSTFSCPHPLAPKEQNLGYLQMISELEDMLAECTGYDVVSLQPNAGSQGEFAGLLAIKGYHESRGDFSRNICLIPNSAHGTNPASAQMCNMKVVVINCDAEGNVDLEDLKSKAELHAEQLAAIMVTYPSTHGVFEEHIKEVAELVHEHGGQVYVDGANLNAMVGLSNPGYFGDVSHLNLHKTFCIPHGGGGPGVGPVAAKLHLAPFLPSMAKSDSTGRPSVSSSLYGSASILPISWMYIRMMGSVGLKLATEIAILNANYIAHRLSDSYSILYKGNHGLVAHECIIDLRDIKENIGIAVDDIAKRLIDYGFHAPTMSFPVAGTLMIEPTESESKKELDRFCDAMLSIKKEIDKIASGEWPLEDNPLVNAPHTVAELTKTDWSHPYTREEASYPLKSLLDCKYFSPVSRIDNVYGDRNLVCSCPRIQDYDE